jgi:hypothetical protein
MAPRCGNGDDAPITANLQQQGEVARALSLSTLRRIWGSCPPPRSRRPPSKDRSLARASMTVVKGARSLPHENVG